MTGFTPYGSRICIVKVTSYVDKNLKGVLQSAALETDVRFDSLTQLLLLMDALFDDINTPQKEMRPRTFLRENGEIHFPEAGTEEKAIAAFRIDVLFRQNASWQGNLTWLDRKEEAQFRSVLELVMLMDSALREKS